MEGDLEDVNDLETLLGMRLGLVLRDLCRGPFHRISPKSDGWVSKSNFPDRPLDSFEAGDLFFGRFLSGLRLWLLIGIPDISWSFFSSRLDLSKAVSLSVLAICWLRFCSALVQGLAGPWLLLLLPPRIQLISRSFPGDIEVVFDGEAGGTDWHKVLVSDLPVMDGLAAFDFSTLNGVCVPASVETDCA